MVLKQTFPIKKCLVFLKNEEKWQISPIFGLEKAKFEEFGLNKANLATLVQNSAVLCDADESSSCNPSAMYPAL